LVRNRRGEAVADELVETIEELAQNPKKIVGDAGTVEEHAVADLIKAQQFLDARAAASRPHGGLRFTRLLPPGANS
jgi:hypothetical protein